MEKDTWRKMKLMQIKIINWNVRGWKSKRSELNKRILKYDIVGLTETKASYKDNMKFTGYTIYRNDGLYGRTGGSGVWSYV